MSAVQNMNRFSPPPIMVQISRRFFGANPVLCFRVRKGYSIYVMQLRSGEDPELRNTLKNASYQGGRAANCFNYSPTEGDGGVRAIWSSPG